MSEQESITTAPYENRFVAFIDILGFGQLVEQADNDPELRRTIAAALLKGPSVLSRRNLY
ncbi:MAG: hypothetical protein COA84_08515 [Robiginitomaculum sp.]|nr:MAG: hypothetical protein COA84_08515 [Robiginitomaculum sp.]